MEEFLHKEREVQEASQTAVKQWSRKKEERLAAEKEDWKVSAWLA